MEINRPLVGTTLTIASGQTVSDACPMDSQAFGGFLLPAAFTGATVSFQASPDGTTFGAVYRLTSAGTAEEAVTLYVTQGRYYALPDELAGCHSFKIVSASAEGAARSIVVSRKG